MDWQITIKRIQNGYILTSPAQSEDEQPLEMVIEEGDLMEDEDMAAKKAMTRVLQEIVDYFGIHYDKWNKNNLKISWDQRGSKVDD